MAELEGALTPYVRARLIIKVIALQTSHAPLLYAGGEWWVGRERIGDDMMFVRVLGASSRVSRA